MTTGRRLAAPALALGLVGLALAGATAAPTAHVVAPGETIYVPDGVTLTIIGGTPPPGASPTAAATPTLAPTASPTTAPTPTPTVTAPPPTPPPSGDFILISRADLLALPTSGAAWQGVLSWAARTPDVRLGDLDSDGDVVTLAKALEYARVGTAARRTEVVAALERARTGTIMDGDQGRALELARGVGAYVLAADLVGYRDPAFMTWVGQQPTRPTNDKTILGCAQVRPNNWGTWCRSSLLIVHLYLGQPIVDDVAMLRGWLGDRQQYAGFSYGSTSWQSSPTTPVGVNPLGTTKSGHPIDGVLPDDQRRSGEFSWPPPCANYVAEALQGATLEATVMTRAGQPAWTWSDNALGRALEWRYTTTSCPLTGDDSSTPFVTDHAYGTHHAGASPSQPGKGWGFGDWLFQ